MNDTPDTTAEPEAAETPKRRRGTAAGGADQLVDATEETVDPWADGGQPVFPGSVHKLVEPIQELVGTPVTGHYDKATVAAVKQLQASLERPQTGVFDAELRDAFVAAVAS